MNLQRYVTSKSFVVCLKPLNSAKLKFQHNPKRKVGTEFVEILGFIVDFYLSQWTVGIFEKTKYIWSCSLLWQKCLDFCRTFQTSTMRPWFWLLPRSTFSLTQLKQLFAICGSKWKRKYVDTISHMLYVQVSENTVLLLSHFLKVTSSVKFKQEEFCPVQQVNYT